jgi:DNA-binding IclR family transcriptional regulator
VSFQPSNGRQVENSLQSLMNGLDVLRLLAQERDLTLTDIANRLHLNKTVVYRLLWTLQQNGVVTRSAEGKRYSVGIRLWEFGTAALLGHKAYSLAAPRLMQLAEQTGESVNFSVYDGASGEVLFLDVVRHARAGIVQTPIALRCPAHCHAAGKVMLAYQDAAEVESYCARDLVAATSATITAPDRLMSELAEIRRLGFAVNRGEWAPEVCGLAVPVLNRVGCAVAAIGVACRADRFSPAWVMSAVEPALEHARDVSRALGYQESPALSFALS